MIVVDLTLAKLRRLFPNTHGKFNLNEGLVTNIMDRLRGSSKPNLAKVAHQNGVPIAVVRAIFEELPDISSVFTRVSEDGWGRQSLRKYIVARKRVDGSWSALDTGVINEARCKYDEGLVELCQGRDGDFTILYAIPRVQIIRRNPYFINMEVETE